MLRWHSSSSKNEGGKRPHSFLVPPMSIALAVNVARFSHRREIRWKSFISPASPIAEQNGDCHKCLNGRMLQPDSQTNPEGREKSPKFENYSLDKKQPRMYKNSS